MGNRNGAGRSNNNSSRPQVLYDISAEADGRRAHQAGLPISCTPFRRGNQNAAREAWERGWRMEALAKVEGTNAVKTNWNHEQRKQRDYGAEPRYTNH